MQALTVLILLMLFYNLCYIVVYRVDSILTVFSGIANSDYYSLLCDETTDISITKELIVYMRYLSGGKSVTRFLEVRELKDGRADTIFRSLQDMAEKFNLNFPTKLAGK